MARREYGFFNIIIKLIFGQTQKLCAYIFGFKKIYLDAPVEVISYFTWSTILGFGHFIPSVALSIILAVKTFPLFSNQYSKLLENNSPYIPLVFLFLFIIVSVLNGWIIEIVLLKTNPRYRSYVGIPSK